MASSRPPNSTRAGEKKEKDAIESRTNVNRRKCITIIGERSKSRVHWPSSSSDGAHVTFIKRVRTQVDLTRSREWTEKENMTNISRRQISKMESGSWFTTRKCFYVAFSSNDWCIDEKAWYLMSSHNLKSILVVAQFMYFWGIKLKLLARWLFKSWNMYLKSFLEFSFVSRLLY